MPTSQHARRPRRLHVVAVLLLGALALRVLTGDQLRAHLLGEAMALLATSWFLAPSLRRMQGSTDQGRRPQ